jgi:dTDP-4-dehydrorhamnose 3,5-epimerase
VKYTPTDIDGVTIIDIEPDRDDRGFVSHSFCANEFAAYGLLSHVAQTSLSYNYARGTLRGMHRQVYPHAEAKLVRCTRGAIADVAMDVRPESRTIEWPLPVSVISERDASWPFLASVGSAAS